MSLTTTAFKTRQAIKIGLAVIIFIPILWGGLSYGLKKYRAAKPIQAEPNIKYGILPKIQFPEKKFEAKNFSLELVSDQLPNFGNQARVYVVFRTDKDFMALETEIQTAKQLGFNDQPRLVGPNIYEFQNNYNQKLVINILDGSFHLTYPYNEDQMLMGNVNLPSKEELITKAKSFLAEAKKLPQDIGENKVSYWKNEGSGLKQVVSQSEANMARIDFYRTNVYDNFKIVSTDVNRAPISVLLTGLSVSGKDIVEVDYKYVNIDRDSFATYPIKSTAEAYNDLKSGNYWPAADVTASTVTIRKINLAYFEPVALTNFMEPVYVFEGDNFTAYVPAVANQFTK
ncbi:MAG TPA: hypothetical protein P5299_00070 [Candidatus Woesebacteria bacterium]|nr:hypothetical protein [Candidatus Woesebacteria bacterium]